MKGFVKKLNNGVEIPAIGLGVCLCEDKTYDAVRFALAHGYRHIDTATLYGNEDEVGCAIKDSGIPREEIFVTTKLWNDDMIKGRQREAFENSLEKLGLDYVDLYLMHWPVTKVLEETWAIMEDIYESGRARAIGVSNFQMNHLMRIMASGHVVPVVNQIELHPYLNQKPLRTFCNNLGIEVTAWSPLGRARMFDDETIKALAEKYGKSMAQIILRWEIQENIIVIPKSVTPERIIENSNIFDFELSAEDMALMNSLNRDLRYGPNPDDF